MRIVLTWHARDRMTRRRIGLLDVEHALANVHTSMPSSKGSVCYIGPGVDGSDLKVWLLHPGLSSNTVTVKSVAWKDVDDD